MDIVIGPSFDSERLAAGLVDLPGVSWNQYGIDYGDSLSVVDGQPVRNPLLDAQTRATLEAVVAAHNPRIQWPPAPTLDALKAAQLASVNAAAQKVIDSVMAQYPDFERLTWATQATEAAAWQAAAAVNRVASLVPWCANAAANRRDEAGNPMTLATFMGKVIEKVQGFTALSSAVAGKRQGYEDAIGAATTPEDVKAIVWSY